MKVKASVRAGQGPVIPVKEGYPVFDGFPIKQEEPAEPARSCGLII